MNSQVRHHCNQIAKEYKMNELQRSEEFAAYQKAVTGSERARHTYNRRMDTIRDLADGFTGKRILDIGCGFGFRTLGIAERGATRIIGIDMDKYRIQEASIFARAKEVDNVEFRMMDAAALEFEAEYFDVVIADEMIHHLEDLPAVVSEMHRVLAFGGIAVISDHNRQILP